MKIFKMAYGNFAGFITNTGQIVESIGTHVQTVADNPQLFGFTEKAIETLLYDKILCLTFRKGHIRFFKSISGDELFLQGTHKALLDQMEAVLRISGNRVINVDIYNEANCSNLKAMMFHTAREMYESLG